MSNSLLLFSKNPEDNTFASQVAKLTGLTYKQATTGLEASAIVDKESPAVIFADGSKEAYTEFENAIQQTLGIFSDKIIANRIHFLCPESLEKSAFLLQSPLFGNFVLRNFESIDADAAHYATIVKATLQDKAFGLQSLMKEGTRIQTVTLTHSTQKNSAIEAVRTFLNAAKFQARMSTLISNAVDELLLNSIFDAPVDALGKQHHARTPRSTPLPLEGKAEVQLQIGFDGNYAGITTIDRFGSLDKQKLLRHIAKGYTETEYELKTSIANAGIGLGTVFRSGGSFFFACDSGQRTEVTVIFKRSENFKKFRDQFKFISTQFYF